MEATSEFAVLISVAKFAFTKAGKELKSLCKNESKEILEILEEPITEIIEGLEEPRTELQQKWWKTKLNSVFLLQTLERKNYCEQTAGLQAISFDTYFDMVKAFHWFESFVEVPCLLETSERLCFYSNLIRHIEQEPVTDQDLKLISSLIGQFLQLAICDQPIVSEENQSEFHDLVPKFLNTVLQYSHLIESLSPDVLSEFLNRVLLLPMLYLDMLNFKKNDRKLDFFSKFCDDLNLKFHCLDISIFPNVLWLKCAKQVSKALRGKSDVDFEEAMNTRVFKVNNFEIDMESLCLEFVQNSDTIFRNLPEELRQDKDRLCDLISSVFEKQKTISDKEREERKIIENSIDYSLKRIENKSPGFEDDIENLLKKADLSELHKAGYLDLFLQHPTVLFKEEYLYKLLDIYKQTETEGEVIIKLRKLLCVVYRNLPLVLQQKFLLYVYQEDINLELLSTSDFNSELTVIFNKFTNNSTNQVLQDVAYLMLLDVNTTMERLVDTVVNNPGQIDTVIQILQLLPDLCKCHHRIHHPDRTLLMTSIDNIIASSCIEKSQEKNLTKFITAILKDYKYKILDVKYCLETSVLDIEQFVSCLLNSYLNPNFLYTNTSPLSLEFSIKLFTTILEASKDKPCDWLINLMPGAILLVIGEIYNEALKPLAEFEYFDRRMLIRHVIHKLLAAMKNVLRKYSFHLEDEQFDWLMSEIKQYDWKIKIILHRFICSFIDNGKEIHTQLLEEVIACVIKNENIQLILQLGVINEEVTAMMLRDDLGQLSITSDSFIIALHQILPTLLPTEWSRLYQIISYNIKHSYDFTFKQLFVEKFIFGHLHEVFVDYKSIEVINDAVIILSSHLPADVFHHIVRSYTGLVQTILNQISVEQSPRDSTLLLLLQLFSCLLITMTIVASEFQETLFVSLLDILATGKKVTRSKSSMSEYYKPPFYLAVEKVEDGQMAQTLKSRLDEMFCCE